MTGDHEISKSARFVVTDDPALTSQPGDTPRFEGITPTFAIEIRSLDVWNWDCFQGTLLAVTFSDGQKHWMLGSAVMVAPGIAICAAHVLDEHLDALMRKQVEVLCFGITIDGAQGWRIEHVKTIPGTDLCILGLRCASALAPSPRYYLATISTRLPAEGERMFIAGFRPTEMTFNQSEDRSVALGAKLVLSSGQVTQRFPMGRDALLVPWPALEIDCPAWGAMSGGPVFDSRGYLLGLISRSMETEDEPSPMICALVWPILGHSVEGGWPMSQGGGILAGSERPYHKDRTSRGRRGIH